MRNLSVKKDQLDTPRINLRLVLSKPDGLFYCSVAKPDSFAQRPDVT